MEEANKATLASIEAMAEATMEGNTEDQIAAAGYYALKAFGSEYPGYPIFVSTGYRGSMGHATPEHREVKEGDIVFLETGGCRHRYHTAIMRTCYIGDKVPDYLLEIEDLINQVMEYSFKNIKPGVRVCDVDQEIRRILSTNTCGATQYTRSAYSIGIGFYTDWGEGEYMSISPKEKRVFQENMTFHFIPWV